MGIEDAEIQAIKARLMESEYPEQEVDDLIRRYREMATEVKVGDERMAKLCQILTDNGCRTYDSCEGHEGRLPYILFFAPKGKVLKKISYILEEASYAKHFPWHIRVLGMASLDNKVTYILEPSHAKGPIDPSKDYKKLMQDLDIIAISILDY